MKLLVAFTGSLPAAAADAIVSGGMNVAGSTAITAAVADISEASSLSSRQAAVGIAGGMGFVFGPILGGQITSKCVPNRPFRRSLTNGGRSHCIDVVSLFWAFSRDFLCCRSQHRLPPSVCVALSPCHVAAWPCVSPCHVAAWPCVSPCHVAAWPCVSPCHVAAWSCVSVSM
jgi:MFS family permease